MILEQEKLGQAIETDRLRTGYTQAELAKKIGVSQQAVQKWENGAIPRSSARNALIRVFGADSEFARMARAIEIYSPHKANELVQKEIMSNAMLVLRETAELNKVLRAELQRYKDLYGEL